MLGGRLLLASDFDGTLARLAMNPWQTDIVPSARTALRRLATEAEVDIALISGRTVADLASRVRVGGVTYLGDHGAQWASASRGFRPSALRAVHEPADRAAADMAERLKREVPARVPEPWLVLEDKGPALTFHYRAAPDVDEARVRVRAAVDEIDPHGILDQPGGRRAWELRPHGATTKGLALARLIEKHRPRVVLMLGDDRHDALAFDALREAREAGRVRGLAVAVASPAALTHEIAPRADLLFEGPEETARFLGLLAHECSRGY